MTDVVCEVCGKPLEYDGLLDDLFKGVVLSEEAKEVVEK